MKNLTLLAVLALTSCSCGLTLSSKKSLPPRATIVSNTEFEVGGVDGWDRVANFMPIPLPGPSYEDITLYNKETETLLFISSLAVDDDLKGTLEGLSANTAKDPDAMKSQVVASTAIPGALEVSIKVNGNEFRVTAVNGKKFSHLIQAMMTKPEGNARVTEFLKTFKLE